VRREREEKEKRREEKREEKRQREFTTQETKGSKAQKHQ
jgi:hypothetical protein